MQPTSSELRREAVEQALELNLDRRMLLSFFADSPLPHPPLPFATYPRYPQQGKIPLTCTLSQPSACIIFPLSRSLWLSTTSDKYRLARSSTVSQTAALLWMVPPLTASSLPPSAQDTDAAPAAEYPFGDPLRQCFDVESAAGLGLLLSLSLLKLGL